MSRSCCTPRCSTISSVNTRDYSGILLTNSRLRFAVENGYRIALNVDSSVTVAFTGTFSSVDVGTTAKSFNVFIQYFNTRLPTNIFTLVGAIVTLPERASSTAAGYYVPVTLVASAPLAAGLYQFDILVTPLVSEPTTTSTGTSIVNYDYSADAILGADPYQVFGAGKLSIETTRKAA